MCRCLFVAISIISVGSVLLGIIGTVFESNEGLLFSAVQDGDLRRAIELLRDHPDLDVNYEHSAHGDKTALMEACHLGFKTLASILLAHPSIDVNHLSVDSTTAFHITDSHLVPLLLHDSRVLINVQANGMTKLYIAAIVGDLAVAKWFLASGRDLDFVQPANPDPDVGTLESPRNLEAETPENFEKRKVRIAAIVELIERFKENPEKIRAEIRLELGITGKRCFCLRKEEDSGE